MSPFVTILKTVDHPLETKETRDLHCISRAVFLSRGLESHDLYKRWGKKGDRKGRTDKAHSVQVTKVEAKAKLGA